MTDPTPSPRPRPESTADLDPPTLRGLALAPQAAATAPTATPAPPTLTGWAQALHDAVCGCTDGGDIPGHGGVSYQAVADELVANIAAALAPAVRHPVEAKVWASASGALAASLGLALVTLLLGRLDVIPSLLGGAPWAGALVLVLGVVLPPAASLLRGYLAEHSPRPTDALTTAPVQ
jgi:hypothetical protein